MRENTFNAFYKLADDKPWLKTRKRDEAIRHLFDICKYEQDVHLLFELINRLEIVSLEDIASFVDLTLEKIYALPTFSPSEIAFVPKQKNDGTDSSQSILQTVQQSFDPASLLTKKNVYRRVRDALKNSNIKRIILIDDFSGSGKSLLKYVNWIDNECDDLRRPRVDVHAYFFYSMEETHQLSYPGSLKTCDSFYVLKKGITGYNSGKNLSDKIMLMKGLEANIEDLSSIYSLGFGQSETLYACDGFSTPNNVFPIFWRRNIYGKTFFRPLLIRS